MPRRPSAPARLAAFAAAVALVLGATSATPRPDRLRLPPIVFVIRDPQMEGMAAPESARFEPNVIPGLGPNGRLSQVAGRLTVREPDGAIRGLDGGGFAVAHPSVSPDGRAIAFCALNHGTKRWEIERIELGLAGFFVDAHEVNADLIQPCWVSDSMVCAVMVRDGTRTQYTNAPVSQLVLIRIGRPDRAVMERREREFAAEREKAPTEHVVRDRDERRPVVVAIPVDTSQIIPLTHERNGAEAPCFDPKTGRILFSRWWFNRWRPTDANTIGITDDVALATKRDTVNLWQIVSIRPDGTDERVEASGLSSRLGSMGYGPAVLADGSIVATYASNLGLSPRPGTLGIQRFHPRLGHAERLVGAIVDARGGSDYGSPRGLAAPAACDPVGLADGRVLFSYDPSGRGDFALYVMNRDASQVTKVFGDRGSLVLDAAPLAPWRVRPRPERAWPAETPRTSSALSPEALASLPTFRFFDRDVFAGGHARPGVAAAPPRTSGAHIRFWAALPRPEAAGGDTAVLVRTAPVRADGSVDERVPAGVPMFEQLIDAHGHVLRSADGSAHVAGFNWGAPGATVTCVGCHTGHSTLERGRIHPPRR